MFTNQYIVTHRGAEPRCELPDFASFDFADLRIHAHAKLKVTIAATESTQVALLGYIIDPRRPDDSDETIVQRLTATSASPEQLHENIECTTGRYVLLFKTPSAFIVTGDALHFRQIHYALPDDQIAMTSSPKLFLSYFDYDLQLDDAKRQLLELPAYTHHDAHWYGDESLDSRLMKLLPNHYLDIAAREVKRVTPFPEKTVADEDEVIGYASFVLQNTFASLTQRYRLMHPLTAGWDSRLLLAASRESGKGIHYYVFDRPSVAADDVAVSTRLSRKLGLDFAVVRPGPVSEEFAALYRREHIMPRVVSKTENIHYHYTQDYGSDVVNVNGNGGEIARCRYGYTRRPVSVDMVCECTPYNKKSEYVYEQLKKWYADVVPFADECGLCVLDLFLWEQRMGNWGALYPFEADIAVEEMSPFNNRRLLMELLSVDGKERRAPRFRFYRRLIAALWPEALSEPFNPSEPFIKGMIRGNATVRYLVSRAMSRGVLGSGT